MALSALDRYRALPPDSFLLLETRSVPRSGLHYLQAAFARILGEDFSFCEWYEAPVCCREMPCAVTACADAARRTGRFHLRMTKSHDFRLSDPDYPPAGSIRRLIVLRDPLYVLTSWWCLEQLEASSAILAEHGIDIRAIRLRHEPALLGSAWELAGRHFDAAAGLSNLRRSLGRKQRYILAFAHKWQRSVAAFPEHQRIIRYDMIPDEVCSLLDSVGPLDPAVAARLAEYRARPDFAARENPFAAPAPRLQKFLRKHRKAFVRTAREIAAADPTGLMATSV